MEAIAEGDSFLEQALLLAVGELGAPCGRCDRCTSLRPSRNWSDKAMTLLVSLHDNQGVAIHSLVENLSKEVDKGEERGKEVGSGRLDWREQ